MRDSAQKLHNAIPGTSLMMLKGKYHGEYPLNCAEEYVEMIVEFLKG